MSPPGIRSMYIVVCVYVCVYDKKYWGFQYITGHIGFGFSSLLAASGEIRTHESLVI